MICCGIACRNGEVTRLVKISFLGILLSTEDLMGATQDAGLELARAALELQKDADELKVKLDAAKGELRDFANGQKLNLVVEGVGSPFGVSHGRGL